MKKVDARGDACPIPVVKAKHAIEELSGAGQVEVLVDNEIAVQNLTKMAEQKGYQSSAKKLADQEEKVIFGGRLGEYRYYDMDKVIEAALKAVKEETGI